MAAKTSVAEAGRRITEDSLRALVPTCDYVFYFFLDQAPTFRLLEDR